MANRIDRRVKDLYWDRYVEFYDAYGLKLNYSIKYERGVSMIHLLKRVNRKSFKPQDGAVRELTIEQIEA